MSTKFADLLAASKLPERIVPICLRGDLVAEFERAERELTAAQNAATNSFNGGGAGAIASRIEALREQMQDSTYDFVIRALPRPKFRELTNAHPPERDADGKVLDRDAFVGVNMLTFFDDLIRACIVDPVLTDAEWTALVDEKLTDKQFDDLSSAAWGLNRREIDIPFSRAASLLSRASAAE